MEDEEQVEDGLEEESDEWEEVEELKVDSVLCPFLLLSSSSTIP